MDSWFVGPQGEPRAKWTYRQALGALGLDISSVDVIMCLWYDPYLGRPASWNGVWYGVIKVLYDEWMTATATVKPVVCRQREDGDTSSYRVRLLARSGTSLPVHLGEYSRLVLPFMAWLKIYLRHALYWLMIYRVIVVISFM